MATSEVPATAQPGQPVRAGPDPASTAPTGTAAGPAASRTGRTVSPPPGLSSTRRVTTEPAANSVGSTARTPGPPSTTTRAGPAGTVIGSATPGNARCEASAG